MNLREFWKEFRASKLGMIGLGILGLLLLLGIFGQLLIPFPDATSHWRDIAYWQDNPQAAPPVWINGPWNAVKTPASVVIKGVAGNQTDLDNGVRQQDWTFDYDFQFDRAPRDLLVSFKGSGQIPLIITVTRPDGLSAEIYRAQLDLAEGESQRISVGNNAASAVIEFIRNQKPDIAATLFPETIKPTRLLFATMAEGMAEKPVALKGTYTITLTALLLTADSEIRHPVVRVSGFVSGWLGTDMSKRDLFTGIVLGIRWALLIGILTSLISVLTGVLFGVIAAYFGGRVDWVFNRIYEYVYLMPVLPFLIVISALYKPSIWTLIGIICVFFWVGAFKPVYSMVLQLREETFVEASRALGASKWRIILRHIFPMVLPYSIAVMALSIPGVIIFEASISLLGLGDSNIVTWGQILQAAYNQGAVINNLWWWVVPPGLMIALMGMAFIFLGSALDKILHPKLKTR